MDDAMHRSSVAIRKLWSSDNWVNCFWLGGCEFCTSNTSRSSQAGSWQFNCYAAKNRRVRQHMRPNRDSL